MIDTHVHINVSPLYEKAEAVIEEAHAQGVKEFLVVGFDPKTIQAALTLADRFESVKLALGFHPTVVAQMQETDYQFLATALKHPAVRAYGEIGIDLHWEKETLDLQKKHLHRQLKTAKSLDLPVVIHMRDATEVTYQILKEYAPLKGVMHCYSGPLEMLQAFLDLGLHIGLDGPVTFKNAKTPKAVAKEVPLDRLLLETDAPYLAPHPYRGTPNTPAYLPLIASAIAELRGMSVSALIDATTHNASALFNLYPQEAIHDSSH